MTSETDAVKFRRGKWSEAGVPHKDWWCASQFDTFEVDGEGNYRICEMCEVMEIRFVQVMQHQDYPGELDCGCVCAGHMSEDRVGAESRDKELLNRSRRRKNFPNRKGWRTSKNGTPFIKESGYHIMIGHKGGAYSVAIKHVADEKHQWGKRKYPNLDAAKRGCFDALSYRLDQKLK